MKRKKLIALALTGMVALTLQTMPVSAASITTPMPNMETFRVITPRWQNTTLVVLSISSSGCTISVSRS